MLYCKNGGGGWRLNEFGVFQSALVFAKELGPPQNLGREVGRPDLNRRTSTNFQRPLSSNGNVHQLFW